MNWFKRHKLWSVVILLAVFYITAIGVNAAIATPPPKPKSVKAEKISPEAIYNLVNEQRQKANVAALSYNPSLVKSATAKCKDMVKYDYYDHKNPKTGKSGLSFIPGTKLGATYISENLNEGNVTTNKGFVKSWLNSPAHKAAMLDPKYTDTGLAVCTVKSQTTVVEHFAAIPPKPTVVQQKSSYSPVQSVPLGNPYQYTPPVNCVSDSWNSSTVYTTCR